MNTPAPVFGDINIVLGIDSDAVRLVELSDEGAGPAKARQDLARLAVDDFNLRVVLVDEEDVLLIRIV